MCVCVCEWECGCVYTYPGRSEDPSLTGIHPDNCSCSVSGNPDDWERKQKEVQRVWRKLALISAWGGNALTFTLLVIKDTVNLCVSVCVRAQCAKCYISSSPREIIDSPDQDQFWDDRYITWHELYFQHLS